MRMMTAERTRLGRRSEGEMRGGGTRWWLGFQSALDAARNRVMAAAESLKPRQRCDHQLRRSSRPWMDEVECSPMRCLRRRRRHRHTLASDSAVTNDTGCLRARAPALSLHLVKHERRAILSIVYHRSKAITVLVGKKLSSGWTRLHLTRPLRCAQSW